MRIAVAYITPARQFIHDFELEEGATVASAIERSGVCRRFPDIDLSSQKVGVTGKLSKLDALVADGDRVEIYRPITADPETVPRRDIPEEV